MAADVSLCDAEDRQDQGQTQRDDSWPQYNVLLLALGGSGYLFNFLKRDVLDWCCLFQGD